MAEDSELIPTVEVELDRPRRLTEDYHALALFEQTTGVNARDPQAMAAMNTQQHAAYVWALLRGDDPDLDLATVQDWVCQPRYFVALTQGLAELMVAALEMVPEAERDVATKAASAAGVTLPDPPDQTTEET